MAFPMIPPPGPGGPAGPPMPPIGGGGGPIPPKPPVKKKQGNPAAAAKNKALASKLQKGKGGK